MIFVVLGIVAVFAVVIGVSLWQGRSNPTDFEGYNLGEVIAADDQEPAPYSLERQMIRPAVLRK